MTEVFRDAIAGGRFLCVAHRGASAYAPENTLEAFSLALEQGADVLELDVHLTRDERAVVMHDARVDRTTNGSGETRAMTLAEIQALDAGAWFGARWKGVRAPSLREALERFAARALVDIEIKAGVEVDGGVVIEDPSVTIPLARKILEAAERAGAMHRVIVSGFCAEALQWVRASGSMVPHAVVGGGAGHRGQLHVCVACRL